MCRARHSESGQAYRKADSRVFKIANILLQYFDNLVEMNERTPTHKCLTHREPKDRYSSVTQVKTERIEMFCLLASCRYRNRQADNR